ncbi:MAG: DoxX family protein [Polyangiaceae bacterium]
MNARTKTIAYWVTTGLVAAAFLAGGLGDLSRAPEVAKGMAALGYPLYFLTILGVWKVLGALAIVAPGMPRLKEWAYAGIVFDLTGAAASHAFSGDPMGKVVTPIVILAIAAASWALRPEPRKLTSASTARVPGGPSLDQRSDRLAEVA